MIPIAGLVAAILCLVAVAALVLADVRGWELGHVGLKLVASTAFVVLSWQCGAWSSLYGRGIFVALLLSWIGDLCLLSSGLFLAGLVAFLLAHLAFAGAFILHGVQLVPLGFGVLLAGSGAVGTLVWLWPRLTGVYRMAVPAYAAAIVTMGSLSIASGLSSGNAWLALGGAAFLVSDIAVARNQFGTPHRLNTVWGLPLYYLAQVLFAWSVWPTP